MTTTLPREQLPPLPDTVAAFRDKGTFTMPEQFYPAAEIDAREALRAQAASAAEAERRLKVAYDAVMCEDPDKTVNLRALGTWLGGHDVHESALLDDAQAASVVHMATIVKSDAMFCVHTQDAALKLPNGRHCLYLGGAPAHIPADVEALDDAHPLMALAECAALLENPRLRGDGVRCEVAAKNARSAMHLLAADVSPPQAPQAVASDVPLAWQDTRDRLIAYVLQDDLHNRLTPRVVDIAYAAFMCGRTGKNADDGGPCDWFNDTKPMVMEAIAKIAAALATKGANHG